jgi:hypothetical protein
VVSYNGRIAFGLTADFHALPEAELLAGDIERALRELAAAAGVGSPTRITASGSGAAAAAAVR